MYEEHFQFSEAPFSLTPDTQFFLNQNTHKAALNTILVALKHCEGFIKIVGEVGTGKTILSRILMSRLSQDFVTAYIPNPFLSPEELKFFVAQEVGASFDKSMAAHELMSSLYRRLVQLCRSGKQVVVIIDEAQAMPRDTVECLRLLTNLETEKRKLLQVVMLGQPELDKLLARPDLRQLKQRIVFSEYIKPLTKQATASYILHRVAAVCHSEPEAIFSRAAISLIYRASRGTPRLINILCHKSLISAYGRAHTRVSVWHAARAVCDTPECQWLSAWLAHGLALESLSPKQRLPA